MPPACGAPVAPVRAMEYRTAYARKVLVNLALDEGRHHTRRRDELGHAGAHSVGEHADDGAGRVLGGVESSTDLTKASASSRRASASRSCCAISTICPRRKWPRSWAVRWAPSRARRRAHCNGCGASSSRPSRQRRRRGAPLQTSDNTKGASPMKTEFEADLRQAFEARAAAVPVAAASRLRSMDYRPRSGGSAGR